MSVGCMRVEGSFAELLEFLENEVLLLFCEPSSSLPELSEFGLDEFGLVGSGEKGESTTETEEQEEKKTVSF